MEEKTKVLIVGVNLNHDPDFENGLLELENLAEACDMEVVGVETQNISQVHTGVYIGKGKVEEIKALAHMLDVEMVIFSQPLSPMQLRNLNQLLERSVIDRTSLILEIFSRRARTREAQIQVETARLQYELPRLAGIGEMLSRQGGGAGGGFANKGAGEKKLELDRRKIRHRISELKKELKEVEQNRETMRKRRLTRGIPQVALVGYTNAGKSTLMNALLDRFSPEDEGEEKTEDRKVFVKDMLFATLDTTVRRIVLPDRQEFLLSDTVGFVSRLPHNLVESFRSTLEEVCYADLLLHVVDYSDPNFEEEMEVTGETLRQLGAEKIPCIHVYNKCDLLAERDPDRMPEDLPKVGEDCIYMAAGKGIGLDQLADLIGQELAADTVECQMLIPYAEGSLVSYLNENALVHETEYLAEGTRLSLRCKLQDLQKYKKYVL